MSDAKEETPKEPVKFDFAAFPEDTCFYERRTGQDRRASSPPGEPVAESPATKPPQQRRVRAERRRRIDPTTFEKQYTPDEMEFMSAMQHFKIQSGKSFPTFGEVLQVAHSLGYRRVGTAQAPHLSAVSGEKT